MLKQLGIPLVWILLSGALIAPIASLPAFAVDTTTTTLVSSQNPSTLDQVVTFTAAVTPPTATGVVIFNDTSTTPPTILDVSVISGGLAAFSISSLSSGNHDIVAAYLGDASNLPSTSVVLAQTVNKIGTTTTITSSLNPSAFGQLVNFTATIAPLSGSLIPTGTIQFLVNGTVTGSPVTLTGGHASFVMSSLSAGTHSISAIYSGNAIFAASTGTLIQTTHQIGTTMSLTSSQNPSTLGQPVTFTASLLPISATGTVQFNDTSVTPHAMLGTATLSGGTAAFSTSSLSAGLHTIVAKYLGDINNVPSTSNIVTQTVNSTSASATSLSSNMTSIISGHSITFTAMVSPSSATGTVQFKVNGTNLGSPVTLSSSQAIFNTVSLPLGSDIVSASYSGNTFFNSSTSNSVTITVASTTTSQNATVGKINGNGNFGNGNNFEFNVDSTNGTTFKGHLNYHDKTAHFNLHSTQITSFSVDSSMTHIVIMGQAKTKGNPHDATQLTFTASITISGKKSQNDQFSIVVTDNSGIVYQKSGTTHIHLEFNKLKTDNPGDENDQKDNDKNVQKNSDDNGTKNNIKINHTNNIKITHTSKAKTTHTNNGKNGHKNNKKDD